MPLFGKKKQPEIKPDIREVQQAVTTSPLERLKAELEKVSQPVQNAPAPQQQPLFAPRPVPQTPVARIPVQIQVQRPQPVKMEYPERYEHLQERQQQVAPVFVKIDKYRSILNSMNYLKTSMVMLKNTFTVLSELEKIRDENIRLMMDMMGKIEKRLATLDAEFLRPSGFTEEMDDLHDVEGIESTLTDLHGQIEEMRTQLDSLA